MDGEELGRMAHFRCMIKKVFHEETIAESWMTRVQIFEERTFQTEGTVDAKFLWKRKSGIGEEQKKVWGLEQRSQGREQKEMRSCKWAGARPCTDLETREGAWISSQGWLTPSLSKVHSLIINSWVFPFLSSFPSFLQWSFSISNAPLFPDTWENYISLLSHR